MHIRELSRKISTRAVEKNYTKSPERAYF